MRFHRLRALAQIPTIQLVKARWVCVLPRALAIVLGWVVVHDDSGDGADLL